MPRMATASDGGMGNSGAGGGKKKFGKNLNKLIKPAAPPIPQTVGGNQRNGLLLLSAQKKSSGGLLSAKSSSSAAVVPAAPHSTKAYEPTTASTHDALLSAVTGKTERDANHAPDAWGVAAAEKNQQQQQQEQSTTTDSAAPDASTEKTVVVTETPSGPSWDDYGGRGATSTSATLVDPNTGSAAASDQDQVQYMSRLARERSSRARAEEDERMTQQRERAAARLRELDEKHQYQEDNNIPPPQPRGWDRTRSGTRTLWEPSQKLKEASATEPKLQTIPASVATTAGASATTAAAAAATTSSVTSDTPSAEATSVDGQHQPVIHLSSYEDRDRGERSAAPRMLYDPKSGSMVAVKERDEKKKVRGRKSRKERAAIKQQQQQEGKGGAVSEDSTTQSQSARKQRKYNRGAKNKITRSRLPRTCGVLYERDEKGQYRCTDGCDGDLGYGAHSVPGGRVLNPEAYQEYLAIQEEVAVNGGMAAPGGGVYGVGMYGGDAELALQTGFIPSEAEDEPQPLEPLELVTADDKLELVGMEDSPTLKPTAKEWAPSQAAIAAAAAAAQKRGASDDEREEPAVEEEPESEEEDDGSFGLGFDPQNMTGLIQSPPNPVDESAHLVASVDLDSLKLDPPMFSAEATKTDATGTGHVFAFGSAGTWGTKTGTETSTGDWGGATGGLFSGVDAAFVGNNAKSATHSNPFINLPATGTSTWGGGLGGLSLNSDSKAATGD